MKTITSVTKEISECFFLCVVLSYIYDKWLCEYMGNPIFIQQDNARLLIEATNLLFLSKGTKQGGFDVRPIHQSVNSPDFDMSYSFIFFPQAIQLVQDNNFAKRKRKGNCTLRNRNVFCTVLVGGDILCIIDQAF